MLNRHTLESLGELKKKLWKHSPVGSCSHRISRCPIPPALMKPLLTNCSAAASMMSRATTLNNNQQALESLREFVSWSLKSNLNILFLSSHRVVMYCITNKTPYQVIEFYILVTVQGRLHDGFVHLTHPCYLEIHWLCSLLQWYSV